MNVLSHKSSTINGSVTQGSSSEEAGLTSLWQKKKLIGKRCTNPALLPQHVEMQCEKGIKPPTHKRKRGEMTVTALAKPLIYPQSGQHSRTAQWNTVESKAEGRRWKKDNRDERDEEMEVKRGGTGAEHRRSESKHRRETEWKSWGQGERWHYAELQSPEGFLLTRMIRHCLYSLLC